MNPAPSQPRFGLQPEQRIRAATLLSRAFCEDPIVMAILSGFTPDRRRAVLSSLFQADLQYSSACPASMLIGNTEPCGAAIVHPPGSYPLSIRAQLAIAAKGLLTVRSPGAAKRWLEWLSAIAKQHPNEPHYYLEFIGVAPAYQGQGYGVQMLKALTARADTEQMPCYLETGNPKNVPLYQRYRFETIAEQTVVGVHTWFMRRPGS